MERTFETHGPVRLDVRIPGGDLRIEAVETAETRVEVDASADLLERTTIEQRGDEILVHVRDRRGLFLSFGKDNVDVRIQCPLQSSLLARTSSADVVADGPLADVRVETASGDTRLDVAESVSVQSASGDVDARIVAGDLSVQTASGDVGAGHVGGDLKAQVVSGDVRVHELAGSARVNSVSGDVRLESVAHGETKVESVSGDVEVGVRRGSRVYVDASSLSGDPRSELALDDDGAAADDAPLVELRIKTVSGDIAIVRAPSSTPQEV